MKQVDLHKYKDYRRLIDELLALNQLSYRGFATKSRNLISFPTLSKVLIKDPKGQYKQGQNLSPEKLTLLLKFFGYSREEIRYALLLRFENDCQVLPQAGGSLCKLILAQLVQVESDFTATPAKKNQDIGPASLSKTALRIGQSFDLLPEIFQKRMIRTVVNEISVVLERQKYFPGIVKLKRHFEFIRGKQQ